MVNTVSFPADHIAQAPSLTSYGTSATCHKWFKKGGGDVEEADNMFRLFVSLCRVPTTASVWELLPSLVFK